MQSLVGSVLLDFTRADNPHPVVEVELEIAAGSVKLLLPDGATANVDDLLAALGEIKSRVPSRPRAGRSALRGARPVRAGLGGRAPTSPGGRLLHLIVDLGSGQPEALSIGVLHVVHAPA